MKLKKQISFKTVNINGIETEIPSDWKISKIKDLFKVKNGDLILEKYLEDNGKYPVYSATVRDTLYGYVNSPKTVLRANLDIVIPSRGTGLGLAKLPKTESTSTQTTVMLIAKELNEALSKYITTYIRANKKTLFRDKKGAAILQINKKEIEEIEIPIPKTNKNMNFIYDIINKQEELLFLREKELLLDRKKLIILQQELLRGRVMNDTTKKDIFS